MKINTLLSYAALVALISSCDLNKKQDDTPATTAPATIPAANTVQPATTQQSVPAPASQTTTAPAPASVAPGQLSQHASGAVALNPAHGQPGHDCSIPVGQPLKKGGGASNGAVQVSTTPTQQGPTITTTPPPQPLSGGNAKLNPAHGQPGHRCDIAVGAPLN